MSVPTFVPKLAELEPRLARMNGGLPEAIIAGLRRHLATLYPHLKLESIEPLAPDTGSSTDVAEKVEGYGKPVKLRLVGKSGDVLELVWRVASANEFGHDRRADRAAGAILAYDDFARIPRHIEALDVGAVGRDGTLVSLPPASELYLITTYAPGALYAGDLRRIAQDEIATDLDIARVDALAHFLARLHAPVVQPHAYRRAIRDLIGHGEGIFGIIDGYPADVPEAPAERLMEIERRCVAWRWRLRRDEDTRLVRTHGDFHPFNIVFDSGTHFALLDASRGGAGDAADDLTALAINFVLFALERPASWRRGFGPLWRQLWRTYSDERPDSELLAVAPPFFAWRALVVCNPRFYPHLSAPARRALLELATRALVQHRFELAWADELFP